MMDYRKVARELGELVTEKQRAHGDAVTRSAQILAILYPDGVRREHYPQMLLTVRVCDKLSRIATDPTAFGESPWRDIAGYGILGAAMSEAQPAPVEKAPAPKKAPTPAAKAPTKRAPDLGFARALDASILSAQQGGFALTVADVVTLAGVYNRHRKDAMKALKVRIASGRLSRGSEGRLWPAGVVPAKAPPPVAPTEAREPVPASEPRQPETLGGESLVHALREAVSVDTANRAAMAYYADRGLPLPDGAPAPVPDADADIDIPITRRADAPATTATAAPEPSAAPKKPVTAAPAATTATPAPIERPRVTRGRDALDDVLTRLVRDNGQVSRVQMVTAAAERNLSHGLADLVIRDAVEAGVLIRVEPGIFAPPGPVRKPAPTAPTKPKVTAKKAPEPKKPGLAITGLKRGTPDAETVAEWRRMLAAGKSTAHIASAYERSVRTVHEAVAAAERADVDAAVQAGRVTRLPGAGSPELAQAMRERGAP